jgi:hypothetical protein
MLQKFSIDSKKIEEFFKKKINFTRLNIILSIFFSSALTAIFFHGVESPFFIFIHDEYLPFFGHEISEQFYIINRLDFGTSNTFQVMVNFFDRIYYSFSYFTGITLLNSQMVLYFIKLFLIICLPLIGFRKLSELFSINLAIEKIIIVSFWYSFNPFTFLYFHGNAFPLTLIISYALAPLALYLWIVAIFPNIFQKHSYVGINIFISLAFIFFLMGFALYLFAAFVMLLVALTLFQLIFSTNVNIKLSLRNIIKVILLCLPIFSLHFIIIYEMFFLSTAAQNVIGNETNGNIQGSMLYMALMWFTWPMYVVWTPRNFWTFTDYLRTPISLMAPFIFYAMIFFGLVRQKKNIVVLIFSLMLLLFILLAKGPQEPFGAFYLFLLENVPGFRVFRSPDTKLGFNVVLCLSMLLLFSAFSIKSKYFFLITGFVILVQSWPLFSGLGIRGENTDHSRDRVIYIPDEYKGLQKFFNSRDRVFGYVMPLPAVENGRFLLDDTEEHAGQDLLPKIIDLPFVYVSESSGMSKTAYDKLVHIYKTKNYPLLRDFGIRYYLFRTDIISDRDILKDIKSFVEKKYSLIFQSEMFELYEDRNSLPLVQVGSQSVNLRGPSRVDLIIPAEYEGAMTLHQNFNSHWHIYDNVSSSISTQKNGLMLFFSDWLEAISFLWRAPLFEKSHYKAHDFSNGWILNKSEGAHTHNQVDSQFRALTIFYLPQAVFCLLLSISTIFFVAYGVILMCTRLSAPHSSNK